jgi:3-hydroxyisobutyrate dehydrogenase
MTRVTVLGTGLMGAAMTRAMLRAGLEVTVWNRTAEKALPLAREGAAVAEGAEAAVRAADVVVTMLFDADAVERVMERALPVLPAGAVWAQCGTVGLDATGRLAEMAERRGVAFVDAPVLGTRMPAEEGRLIVLAGGDAGLREQVAPVFEAIGARTVWVGDRPGDGHRLKLVANSWVLSVTAATAQSVGLAARFGLDPRLFLDLIAGGALDCPYAQTKGRAMIEEEFSPAFTLEGAVKDAALIAGAMRAEGFDDRLMRALHAEFEAGAKAGHAAQDMAAVIHAFR